MPGLQRGENVLAYLIDLNNKQPIEKMGHAEMVQLLKAMGCKQAKDYARARRKLLWLVSFFDRE